MNTKSFFSKKRILVTGACGTVGRELVRQLLEDHAIELVGVDNNESELFFLEQQFSEYGNAKFFMADIRDGAKLTRLMQDIDIVFHTAAYKHVILCERSPYEAVQTNVLGVQNIILAASENHVERVIFTSSDKAVNPTNVMGTSKLMGERLMTAADSKQHNGNFVFASTRFGNVLGSRGSVIPIFREQIRHGGPVTITDPGMTRFIMSIEEAVGLVIDSAYIAQGGEVFVTKMPVIAIKDLAEVMIRELAPQYGHQPEDIEIRTIGSKPGEKMYEELMNEEETRRTWELPQYFVVLPAFTPVYRTAKYNYPEITSKNVTKSYHSANEKAITQEELTDFLRTNKLLEEDEKMLPAERYWPDK
ncbi:SDR family NAD(P)-dependent oxidoreductase [Desulfonema magnum]|uniref:Polysaccharide biosynthesis protein, CapD-like n=1 Tax=Desulfonema magnum TaxID=45655 RepID=A0A975GTZ0_9BACT|nr:SDR family NAD(P)-dependent oxidoreductase [Desulfonema magnum]QTA93615.1 Polysaccharide biosynthesis protein, CapD-like [Desulfonema magnum]